MLRPVRANARDQILPGRWNAPRANSATAGAPAADDVLETRCGRSAQPIRFVVMARVAPKKLFAGDPRSNKALR